MACPRIAFCARAAALAIAMLVAVPGAHAGSAWEADLMMARLVPGYRTMSAAEIARQNPYVLCTWLHYQPADRRTLAIADALLGLGRIERSDAPGLANHFIRPGMTTCAMLITMGMWEHMSTDDYGGRCSETQWSFDRGDEPEASDEELVYTACGRVTAVQNQ